MLTVNNVYAILRAVAKRTRASPRCAEFMAAETPGLVRVLPDIQGPRVDAYFVYPEELRNSKRIQVFRDFLLRKVAEADFN